MLDLELPEPLSYAPDIQLLVCALVRKCVRVRVRVECTSAQCKSMYISAYAATSLFSCRRCGITTR